MNRLKLRQDLERFFIEDIGAFDLTSQFLFDQNVTNQGVFITNNEGIFVGEQIIKEGFYLMSEKLNVQTHVSEGGNMDKGTIIATVEGPVVSLLAAERVILNLVQRMSAIATLTRQASVLLKGSTTKICDTRKTTPGLRMFEKYAVRCGGGVNHRYTLDGGVMIKDNHITLFGSILKAIEYFRQSLGPMTKIEVETETIEQVEEAVAANADIIMFDNCSPERIQNMVQIVPEHITTEASGGITLDTLSLYRECGVQFISLGALTHSVKNLDISFELEGFNHECP